jgi:hypothetical protein
MSISQLPHIKVTVIRTLDTIFEDSLRPRSVLLWHLEKAMSPRKSLIWPTLKLASPARRFVLPHPLRNCFQPPSAIVSSTILSAICSSRISSAIVSRILSAICSSCIPFEICSSSVLSPICSPPSPPRFVPLAYPLRRLPVSSPRFIPLASAPQLLWASLRDLFLSHPRPSPPNYSSSESTRLRIKWSVPVPDFGLWCSFFRFHFISFHCISFDFDSFQFLQFRLLDSIFLFCRDRLFFLSEFVCNVLLPLLVFSLLPFVSIGVILLLVFYWNVISALIRCR